MTLPQSIQATVSPATIDKVGRLFNGGATDVLNELLQNARRAGAREVTIEQLDLAGHQTLVVRDDGRGIDDPRMLLTLGVSDWSEGTRASEDPAGMGVFSMAGLRVEYRSYSRSAGHGWRVVIEPDGWAGRRLLAIEPFDIAGGTEVLIDMPEAWDRGFERIVAAVARHYPLPVLFQGTECERKDWLLGARHVDAWRGSRIGVFHEPSRPAREPRLNFHGVAVPLLLPSVSEVDRGCFWTVRVDIGDTPELQLVLPARKEVVQTPFLDELRAASERAIYRAIAKAGPHRLTHEHYVRAAAYGAHLSEADPMLYSWIPPVSHNDSFRGEPTRRPMVRMGAWLPPLAQTAARAIALCTDADIALVDEEPGFAGYAWYDALERVTDLRLRVLHDGIEHIVSDDEEAADLASGRVDALLIEIEIATPDDTARTLTFPTDVAIIGVDEYASDIDAIALLVGPEPKIEVPGLVVMLTDAAFRPSDDNEADSYSTQEEYFDRDAVQLARTHLVSVDAGIIGRASDRVQDHIRWLVPEGRTLLIAATRDEAMVAFADEAIETADEAAFIKTIETLVRQGETSPQAPGTVLGSIRAACVARRRDRLVRSAIGAGGEGKGGES